MRLNPFSKPHPVVPLVRLEGAIGPQRGPGRSLNLESVGKALEKAFETKGAKAVAIALNSPGGTPVQSNLIYLRIRELAARKELPVLVFCEDVAASGGYWIALAGDEIWADPGSIVGSIGVISAGFGFTGLIERIGVERRVHTSGEDKSLLDPFRPERERDLERLRRLHAGLHGAFIALVKERRGAKLAEGADLFDGEIWLGGEALGLGLIDGLGAAETVLRERFGEKTRIKRIGGPKKSLLARLLGGGAQAALDAAEQRLVWSRYGL